MFNKALQVKLVKTPKSQPAQANTQDTTFEGKAAIVAYTVDKGIHKVAMAALAYVALDTLRQVLVASASK